MKHLNVTITGRVQGVFYRASTHEKAVQLGLAGFVRNQPDGSVYLEAEGDPQQLDALIQWCHQGPPRAKVEKVTATEGEIKNFTTFAIQR